MNTTSDEFRKRLLATFKVEATEHLAAMVSGLVALEKTGDAQEQSAIIERAFRDAHSLKGAARAVNLPKVEIHCQSLESRFSALKRHEIEPSRDVLDKLHRTVSELVGFLDSTLGDKTADGKPHVARSPASAPLETGQRRPPPQTSESSVDGTVRIGIAKLDKLFLEAEELVLAKLAAARQASDLDEAAEAVSKWRRKGSVTEPALRGIEKLLRMESRENGWAKSKAELEQILAYLEWESAFAKSLENSLKTQARSADQSARFLAARADTLLEEVKRVLMLPFSTILELAPKMVRDLSREQSKEIEFVMNGTEVEVDKRILEQMKDALIHLLRNSVDHGIEKPEVRASNKKPPLGSVRLSISQRGDRVEIRLEDDGAGIDSANVVKAAVNAGAATQTEAEKLDETGVLSLVFRSGVSTSPTVTDISGRGLGLAIVQEKVQNLGGSVVVETKVGAGTKFFITLPVTLATFRGVLVRTGDRPFVVPTLGVERVVRVSPENIRTVENRESIELAGKAVALVRIEDLLGLDRTAAGPDGKATRPVLILRAGEQSIACGVDEVLGEQEILVKSTPKPFSRLPNVAGATILGTGQVTPVLSVQDLIKSVGEPTHLGRGFAEAAESNAEAAKAILVAEDSITARSLLKGILESAGYKVKTAVDGADAFATLKTEDFDLVVSDVEMPRMTGFELTAKIRADKALESLPVILVTGLESREDRERGLDVGANAYIVKSSFDQSDLLDAIHRLI